MLNYSSALRQTFRHLPHHVGRSMTHARCVRSLSLREAGIFEPTCLPA